MDLNDFQRKAILLIFISILIGAILLARKEPLKEKGVSSLRPAPITQKIPTPAKIDINTADISAIAQLPGIGPGLAKAIIDNRPYSTADDLLKVPGIGEKRFSRIKEFIDLPESSLPPALPQRTRAIAQSVAGGAYPTKIDLNNATIGQLSNIPGIGPILGQAILDYREKNVRFNNLEELMKVPRIGQTTYEKIKEYLYIEKTIKPQTADTKTQMPRDRPKQLYDSRIDPKVKCPYCGKQLWKEGSRKQKYIRCPNCLKLLNE